MRTPLALCALALMMSTPPAIAHAQPRGSYERLCTDIRMNGQFLSATCRGTRGPAQSSLNVGSCASDIGVDAEGGLVCAGPGPGVEPRRGDYPPPGTVYDDRRGGGYDDRRDGYYGRETATLFAGRAQRGQSIRIIGPTPNLSNTGLNDRVGSIQLDRRSGPWIVCTDANYRGRCTTVNRSVNDTRSIGMRGAISSLRPAYDRR